MNVESEPNFDRPLSEAELKDAIRGTGWNITSGEVTTIFRRISEPVAKRLELPEFNGLIVSMTSDEKHTQVIVRSRQFREGDLVVRELIDQEIATIKESLGG